MTGHVNLMVDSAGSARVGTSEGVRQTRAAHIDPGFSLSRHLCTTAVIAVATATLGIALAWGANPWIWLTLPVFWIVANFFEWAIHRFPMHRPLHPRIIYTNHSIIHHRSFAGEHQQIHGIQELGMVMMPWYTLLFVLATGVPVAVALGLLWGWGFAGVFYVAAVTYFVFYELTHTLHHLPDATLSRWGLRPSGWYWRVRRHHHHHHRLERMAHANFNVTIPLADRVLGTWESPAPSDRKPSAYR